MTKLFKTEMKKIQFLRKLFFWIRQQEEKYWYWQIKKKEEKENLLVTSLTACVVSKNLEGHIELVFDDAFLAQTWT